MSEQENIVPVTQVDRDAADKLDDELGFLTERELPIVEQAFARHRLAALADQRDERGGDALRHVVGGDDWREGDREGFDAAECIRSARAALSTPATPEPTSFQARVAPWMDACFGAEISADRVERGDRLLEEILELLQSGGYDPVRVMALRDYVWSRPIGEPAQEVGGVMVTLAAYCLAIGLNMHAAGDAELSRIWTKVEAIRAKQAAKPTGSALPIATPEPTEADEWRDEREAVVLWLRGQSDKGADIGVAADKGSTRRAAYGGGSLALKLAADAIEAGEHRALIAARPPVSGGGK